MSSAVVPIDAPHALLEAQAQARGGGGGVGVGVGVTWHEAARKLLPLPDLERLGKDVGELLAYHHPRSQPRPSPSPSNNPTPIPGSSPSPGSCVSLTAGCAQAPASLLTPAPSTPAQTGSRLQSRATPPAAPGQEAESPDAVYLPVAPSTPQALGSAALAASDLSCSALSGNGTKGGCGTAGGNGYQLFGMGGQQPPPQQQQQQQQLRRLLPQATRPFSECYELGELRGSGSFADVWVCRERASGAELACKTVFKATLTSADKWANLAREVRILSALSGKHPGLVRLKEVLEGERSVHLIMELCRGGDLYDLLSKHGRLPEHAARLVIRQVASALCFCHSHGVIHRDIKPENILFCSPARDLYRLTSPLSASSSSESSASIGSSASAAASDTSATTTAGAGPGPGASFAAAFGAGAGASPVPHIQTKLADFGLSVALQPGEKASGTVGSRWYTAPELVQGRKYGRRVDVWSLGVVLCTMLSGKLPFAGKTHSDDEGLRRTILKGKVNFKQPSWDGVSEEAKELIRHMLQVEPSRRLTSFDLLKHPWVLHTPAL